MANPQITTATNITGPDLSASTAANNATQYFNNFYAIPFNVSADTNDAIVAFFEKYTTNRQTAHTMASSVLYTAMSQNIDPLTVLSQFEALPQGQLNSYLAAFLNMSRVQTSILGVNTGLKTSPYITRTILL